MSHPLVRTTEAFLAKHLGLSPTGAVVGAGTNSSAKGGAGSGRGNKEKGDKGRADKAGSSAADQAATDAAAEGMRGLSVAPAADTLEPFVTLLISLSGGKIQYGLHPQYLIYALRLMNWLCTLMSTFGTFHPLLLTVS